MVALVFDARTVQPQICEEDVDLQSANENFVQVIGEPLDVDLSLSARTLLKGFASIPDHFKTTLTQPPGLLGQFAYATMLASHRPFLKFAVPAALAVLSGIAGRRYKQEDGSGLALNFIVAAASGAGKSDAVEAWENFCYHASKQVHTEPKFPKRVHLRDTRSIQAIMEDFASCPAGVWANDEAGALLKFMLDPKTRSDEDLRDSFNRLFDASEHGREFSPPLSVRSRKDGEKPIRNISMSILLALPLVEFEIPHGNALNGFVARTLIVRHAGRTVKKVNHPHSQLPVHLHDHLVTLIRKAKELDDLYQHEQFDAALQILVPINFSQVQHLYTVLDNELDELVMRGMDDNSPYTSLNRVSAIAKRIAGTLAVVENPAGPVVTVEQLQWAFGYTLQNFALILSDFDTGEVGAKASDEEEAVKRTIRDMLKRNSEWKKIGGVPKKALRELIKGRAPFSSMMVGKNATLTRTLDDMLKNGDLVEVPDPQAGSAAHRPTTYLALSD